MLVPEIESIGTVEGTLEVLVIDGERQFLVHDPLGRRPVTCHFERLDGEAVLRALGRRVAVSGFVRSRGSGKKVSIRANRLSMFPLDDELPGAEAVRGALKAGQ